MKLTSADGTALGAGAWMFALLALLLGFGALVVAADARTKSADAEKAAALGGGVTVDLTEFAIDPAMIHADVDGTLAIKNAGERAAQLRHQGHRQAHRDDRRRRERHTVPRRAEARHVSSPVRGRRSRRARG